MPKAGYANTEVHGGGGGGIFLILTIGVEVLGYDVLAAGDTVFEEDEAEDDEHSGARFD